MHSRRSQRTGFTLIEMMIVVALGAIIVTLAAPSFRNLILMQRLKSINAQVVTDLAFARSEAVSRGVQVQVGFQATAAMSCYVFYTDKTNRPLMCDCTLPAATRCAAGGVDTREIRTVQVPADLSVFINPITTPTFPNPYFAYDPRTGGMYVGAVDVTVLGTLSFTVDAFIDTGRRYRDIVSQSGRASVCVPAGSTVTGEAC